MTAPHNRSLTPAPPWPRVAAAPMMGRTDRHYRFFLRLLSPRTILYTEMVTATAVLRGERQRLLGFDPAEHPIVCQLGGATPATLGEAARIVEDFGYDEIDLNVGCPSGRVAAGGFGVALMAEPERAAACVAAMRAAVRIPVTVKHRIGIAGRDSFEALAAFVAAMIDAGCAHVIVHARAAVLGGISPKQNRSIPPLRYDEVYRLKQAFPRTLVILNGGVGTVDAVCAHLERVDGVMIGRALWETPWLLTEIDRRLDGAAPEPSRRVVAERFLDYMARWQSASAASSLRMALALSGLFAGRPGARAFRRCLGEIVHQPADGFPALRRAVGACAD